MLCAGHRQPHTPCHLLQRTTALRVCGFVTVQNEKSGAFLPSQDGSRRLRDPRAMRNDYGRLPYHLAMRKGLTWLGEMLDPSVPVRCAPGTCLQFAAAAGAGTGWAYEQQQWASEQLPAAAVHRCVG
jgi:hypothetical protein